MLTRTSQPRRLRATVACVLAILGALAAAPSPASAARCPGAWSNPSDVSLDTIRSATLCLLNAERRERRLRPLRVNPRLELAANRHSRDMVARRYFSHDSPSGSDMTDRVRRTSYLSSTRRWSLGENIAWGSNQYATPHSIVRMWMNSPGHRANILQGGFREIGIGVANGAPDRRWTHRAGTYTTDFGYRG